MATMNDRIFTPFQDRAKKKTKGALDDPRFGGGGVSQLPENQPGAFSNIGIPETPFTSVLPAGTTAPTGVLPPIDPLASPEQQLGAQVVGLTEQQGQLLPMLSKLFEEEIPIPGVLPFSKLPSEARPDFISLANTLASAGGKFGGISDPGFVGATEIGETPFTEAPVSIEQIAALPEVQESLALFDRLEQESIERVVDDMARRGIRSSGATNKAVSDVSAGVQLRKAQFLNQLQNQVAERARLEAGRKTTFEREGEFARAEFRESAAEREQRAKEIKQSTLVDLGINENQLEQAFEQDETGIARAEFDRFQAWLQKVFDLPLAQQETKMATFTDYIGLFTSIITGQQPATSLLTSQAKLRLDRDMAELEASTREREAGAAERGALIGAGAELLTPFVEAGASRLINPS